jgi:hypothetical protein
LWEPYETHRHNLLSECRDCTSRETYYVTATKPNQKTLFGETVPFCCENHVGHTDTLCGLNVEFVPQRNHITFPLEIPTGKCCLGKESLFIVRTIRNTQMHCVGKMQSAYLTGRTLRLHYKSQPVNFLLWKQSPFIVRTLRNTQIHCVGRMQSLYLTGNISRLHYQFQPVNAVWWKSRGLLWEPYGTHRYNVWSKCGVCNSQETHKFSATNPKLLMLFGETFAVYCEKHTEEIHTVCRLNVEPLPNRKHITSPLQIPTG